MKTVDLIHSYYENFNRGDLNKFIELLSDDVIHDINQGGRQTGKQEFLKFMQRMQHCYQEQVKNITVMVSQDGRRAAAEFTVHGTYLANDAELPPAHKQTYSLPCGAFFEIESGKITRVTNYYNLQDWLQQVK